LITDSNYSAKQIYGVALLLGSASSIMLVASLSLTADFIGADTDSSAFIYGFMSLTDKVNTLLEANVGTFFELYVLRIEQACLGMLPKPI